MFRRLPDAQAAEVPVTIDGQPFAARAGDSVAAALLAAGMSPPGRPKGESPSAQREGSPMSPPGRPKGESPSAQREGSPLSPPGRPKGESPSAQREVRPVGACRSTPVSGAARGPYCLMGVCFECLVTIDGRPNQQGCLVPVRAGMRIERQSGARGAVDAGGEA